MMGNIPDVYLLQGAKKRLEMAKAFQDDMGALFFEHTIYDVKDALTSILALCDMADMRQVPQVKKYIQRVTHLLEDVRMYHDNNYFNLNHVIVNIINILKKHYKSKIQFNQSIPPIKANTKSNQGHLEQVLLYVLIEAVESKSEVLQIDIDLVQKERDAVLTVQLRDFHYSPVILKEILSFYDSGIFRMRIDTQGNDTELTIRLPLSFDNRKEDGLSQERSQSVKLSSPKKKLVYGAQERT